jgi:hypothetical protein
VVNLSMCGGQDILYEPFSTGRDSNTFTEINGEQIPKVLDLILT